MFVMCSDDEHSVTTESVVLGDLFHKNIPIFFFRNMSMSKT